MPKMAVCIYLGREQRMRAFICQDGKQNRKHIEPEENEWDEVIMYNLEYCKLFPQSATVSSNIYINKPKSTNDGMFLKQHIQNIPRNVQARYEGMQSLPEPVVERKHRPASSVYETFRTAVPLPSFIILDWNTAANLLPTLLQRASFGGDDSKPLLLLRHIPLHHYW